MFFAIISLATEGNIALLNKEYTEYTDTSGDNYKVCFFFPYDVLDYL